MSKLAQAVSAALISLGCVASAEAAQFVVVANGWSFDGKLTRRVEAAGGRVTAVLPQIGVALVESDDAGFAARAGRIAGIRSATADLSLQFEDPGMGAEVAEDFANPPASGADDFFHDLQWGHAAVDAAGAWNQGYRGAGATVAVLDSGVYCAHADLVANLDAARSTSFVAGETFCNTIGSAHGTHTMGTIAAADNNIGVIGIAPEADVFAVKVLSALTGSGSFGGIIQGMVYAADAGADVINMSLGVRGGLPVGGNNVAELINATARAARYARSHNALVVASAGNDGRDLDHDSGLVCDSDGECTTLNLRSFPSQLPGVLAVSATAPEAWAYDPFNLANLDGQASYTNYGQSAIDHSAPGGDFRYPGNELCNLKGVVVPCWVFDMVLSTTSVNAAGTSFYGWSAGTSMAAPHVSGVAALVVGKHGGEISPAQLERILRASADDLGKPGNDDLHGAGRVNAARAVAE